MSDQTENNIPAIIINSQYIKDFSFEIPHAPEIFLEIRQQPQIQVDINVVSTKMEPNNAYNVLLNMKLNGSIEEKKLFILELSYGAVATINVPQDHVEAVVGIEIPRLLFPFVRSIIAQCLSEGGLPPIMLAPIDFAALYAARKNSNRPQTQS